MSSSDFLRKVPVDIRFEIYSQVFKSMHTILITPRPRKNTVFDALILSCKQIKLEIEKWTISLSQRQKHLHHLFGIFNIESTYFKVCFERNFAIYQRLWTPKEAEANELRDIELWQKTMNKTGTTCTCAWDDTVTGSWDVEHAYSYSACNKHTSFHAWFCHLDRFRGITPRSFWHEQFSPATINALLHPQAFRSTGSPWEDALYTRGWGMDGQSLYASGPLFKNSKPCRNYYWEWDFKKIWEEHNAAGLPPPETLSDWWSWSWLFKRWKRAIDYSEEARRGERDGYEEGSQPIQLELPQSSGDDAEETKGGALSDGSEEADADSGHAASTPSHALPSPPKPLLQEQMHAWALYEAQEKGKYSL